MSNVDLFLLELAVQVAEARARARLARLAGPGHHFRVWTTDGREIAASRSPTEASTRASGARSLGVRPSRSTSRSWSSSTRGRSTASAGGRTSSPLVSYVERGIFAGGSCHMFAAPAHRDALHAFAVRVGLRRAWFQEHRLCSHYDLTASRRVRAVALGAVELRRSEAVALWRSWRQGDRQGDA